MDETIYYNVKVQTFPDGMKRYTYYEHPKAKGYKRGEVQHDGESVERKECENRKRAKQHVFDLARSNHFDYYLTFTFDKRFVDRYNYDACADAMMSFTNYLCKRGNKWIIVPELHEDGAYHFHGLISGELELTHFRGDKYNLVRYNFGFNSVEKIRDQKRICSYISKYMTKEIAAPKGRKRYWASRKLQLPVEDFVVMDTYEFGKHFNNARYQKQSDTPYGMYLIAET